MREMKTKDDDWGLGNLRVVVRVWRCVHILCEKCGTTIRTKDEYGRLKDGFLNFCLGCCEEIGPLDDPEYPTKNWIKSSRQMEVNNVVL